MQHNISSLSLSASRLLLGLLLYPDFNDQPKTTQMLICGIGKETTYRQARRELERAGFVRLEERPGKRHFILLEQCSLMSSAEPGEGSGLGSIYISILEEGQGGSTGSSNGHGSTLRGLPGSTLEALPESTGSTLMVVPQEDYQSPHGSTLRGLPTLKVVPSEDYHPTLIDRCREVDEMDDSGDIASRNGPFAQRKKVQIPLVQEAFSTYYPKYPNPLTDKNAREWLSLNDNSAVQVIQELEQIARRRPDLESPISYIRAAFKGEAQRASVPNMVQSSASVPSSAVQSNGYAKPLEHSWDGELLEPSAEWLEKSKRAQEYALTAWKGE